MSTGRSDGRRRETNVAIDLYFYLIASFRRFRRAWTNTGSMRPPLISRAAAQFDPVSIGFGFGCTNKTAGLNWVIFRHV